MAGETTKDHLIGLLLGAEEDWPRAFEQILRFVGPLGVDGTTHRIGSERLTIEPFDLTDPVRTGLVIDRLAHWYYHPREWLKKAALVNGTYLLNSPFTFQSMEKHSAYCAMLRLGLHVPKTILVPYKNPVDNHRWTYTSAQYNAPFDLDLLAGEVGYPLYMKPFDGGGWRGVSRVDGPDDLHRAYDESGEMLMHLQATVDFDHFARALSIGPETMVMDFRPDEPMHRRYAVTHDFLSPGAGKQAVAISRIVNAFFQWEFNSCEMLVKGDDVHPIDYANACPDVAVTRCTTTSRGPSPRWCAGRRTAWSPAAGRTTTSRWTSTSRSPTPIAATTRSWTPTSRWRTPTSRPSATTTGARRTSATSTTWWRSGCRAPTSTACSSRQCGRRTHRTSTSSSSPTSVA